MTLGIKSRGISLASAILPVVALAIIPILGHLPVFNFSQRHIESQLSAELKLVLLAEPRQLLVAPGFRDWHREAQYAFVQMLKRSRNSEIEPRSDVIKQWGAPKNRKDDHPLFQLSIMVETLDWYIHRISISSWNNIAEITGECKDLLEAPEVLGLWREYEDSLKSKNPDLWTPVVSRPVTTYFEQILNVTEKVSNQEILVNKRAEQASKLAFITSLFLVLSSSLSFSHLCGPVQQVPIRTPRGLIFSRNCHDFLSTVEGKHPSSSKRHSCKSDTEENGSGFSTFTVRRSSYLVDRETKASICNQAS